jgi:hypothetical protein
MIVVCEQGAIADPLLKTENKHKNISRDSYPAKSGTGNFQNKGRTPYRNGSLKYVYAV